jgi:hypothetical protein
MEKQEELKKLVAERNVIEQKIKDLCHEEHALKDKALFDLLKALPWYLVTGPKPDMWYFMCKRPSPEFGPEYRYHENPMTFRGAHVIYSQEYNEGKGEWRIESFDNFLAVIRFMLLHDLIIRPNGAMEGLAALVAAVRTPEQRPAGLSSLTITMRQGEYNQLMATSGFPPLTTGVGTRTPEEIKITPAPKKSKKKVLGSVKRPTTDCVDENGA